MYASLKYSLGKWSKNRNHLIVQFFFSVTDSCIGRLDDQRRNSSLGKCQSSAHSEAKLKPRGWDVRSSKEQQQQQHQIVDRSPNSTCMSQTLRSFELEF